MEDTFQNETYIETITYRGVTAHLYNDDYGQQVFAKFINDPVFGSQEIGFGSFNFNWKDDLYWLIDNRLDTIYKFKKPFYGASLEWFKNGKNHQDIKLNYRLRTLYVWNIENKKQVNLDCIIEQAKLKLQQYQEEHAEEEVERLAEANKRDVEEDKKK